MTTLPPELLEIFAPWAFALLLNGLLLVIGWFAPKKLLTPAGLIHAGDPRRDSLGQFGAGAAIC